MWLLGEARTTAPRLVLVTAEPRVKVSPAAGESVTIWVLETGALWATRAVARARPEVSQAQSLISAPARFPVKTRRIQP